MKLKKTSATIVFPRASDAVTWDVLLDTMPRVCRALSTRAVPFASGGLAGRKAGPEGPLGGQVDGRGGPNPELVLQVRAILLSCTVLHHLIVSIPTKISLEHPNAVRSEVRWVISPGALEVLAPLPGPSKTLKPPKVVRVVAEGCG